MASDSLARALIPALLRMAGPVAVARLGWMGMGVVDTIVVGQIAPHELPFLALGWAPTGVLLVTGIGLLTGVQVLGARAVGEGRRDRAGGVWREGMVLALVTGLACAILLATCSERLLLSFGVAGDLSHEAARVTAILAISLPLQFAHNACASFMESIKRPAAGAIVIWAANGLNIALNLAFVPLLGAIGAAWATVGARLFMLAAMLVWIFFSADARAHGAYKRVRGQSDYRMLLRVGGASAVSQLAESGAFNIMSVIAARIGAEAVATYQILLNVLAIVFMIALGFSAAAAVLVSEAYGRGDRVRMARAGWLALLLNTLCMAACAAGLAFAAPAIARSFTSDLALAAALVALLPLCAFVVIPDGGQSVISQALRGRNDNWFPSASHVVSYVVLMPPLAFFLGEVMERGVKGLIEAIIISSVVSIGVLAARFAWLGRQMPSTQPSSRSTM